MSLPYLPKLTLKSLKALYDQGELHKYSMDYLRDVGLFDAAIWGRVISADDDGDFVWLPQDATGRAPVTEKNSSTISGYTLEAARGAQVAYPTIGGVLTGTPLLNGQARKHIVSFTSNAGGSIDSDPELVPALAGYYGVIDKIIVRATSAETPVFEVQEGTTQIEPNISPGTLVAYTPTEIQALLYGSTDNTAISLDGSGCSGLGNAVQYALEVHYHYET